MSHYSEQREEDMVNNPKHYYLFPGEQSIDLIQKCLSPEEFRGFLKGNCLKYRMRAGKKGDAQQDIEKSDWYEKKLRALHHRDWPENEMRMDIVGQNGNDGLCYNSPAYTKKAPNNEQD